MSASATVSGAPADRLVGIGQRLMSDLGLTEDQARGVLWRLNSESQLRPVNERNPVVPGSRGGFGYAQWTGPRRDAFEADAAANGTTPTDPEQNYQHLLADLRQNYPHVLDAVKGAKTWQDAYKAFSPFESTTPPNWKPPVSGAPPDPDFDKRWSIAPPANQNAPAAPSIDPDFEKRWELSPPAASAPSAPTTVAQPARPAPQSTGPDYTGWDQPTPATAAAKNFATMRPATTGDGGPLSYNALSADLAPAPNTTYGDVLPLARDNATGALRLAMPTAIRSLAQGALDLAHGPSTGTVTPEGTMALGAVAGSMTPSPASAAVRAMPGANALLPAPPAPPLLSQEFRAAPGVTTPQFVPREAPVAAAEPNPLVASAGRANPLDSGASSATPASPAPMSAADQAIYDSIPEKLPPAPKIPPLTQNAAGARADQLIQHFAAKDAPETLPDLVPGYTPTLAQLTNDPGIATLERGVQAVNPNPFGLLGERNQTALRDFTAKLIGTSDDIAALDAQREASTTALRDAAFSNKSDVDATPVSDLINSVLAGPDSKREAITNTLTNVQKSLHVGRDLDAPLESDPEMLYGVRKHINDLLSPAAQRDNPELQAAARQLTQVKGALDDAIESGAPGFKDYAAEFARQSQPIDALKFLQGANLTDSAGNVVLSKVDSTIKSIEKQQRMPGVQKASAVSDDQLAALNTLRNTLRAQQFSATAGKALGSNTFQNLATNSRVGALTGNPLVSVALGAAGHLATGGTLGAFAGAGLNMATHRALENAERMVSQAMVERLLNAQGKGLAALRSSAAP